jgi:hypothetical protein
MTMAETDAAQPPFGRDPENVAAPQNGNVCAASVLSAYTAAMERSQNERGAFDAAVHTYLLYNPNTPEQAARRAVAGIISWKE